MQLIIIFLAIQLKPEYGQSCVNKSAQSAFYYCLEIIPNGSCERSLDLTKVMTWLKLETYKICGLKVLPDFASKK